MNEFDSLKKYKDDFLARERNARLALLYGEMAKLARDLNQTVGEKHDYYLTIAQIEGIIIRQE